MYVLISVKNMFGAFELCLGDMFTCFLRFSQLFLHGAQVAGAQACSLRRLHTRLLLPNLPASCPPATAAPGAGGALCRAMCWQVSANVFRWSSTRMPLG